MKIGILLTCLFAIAAQAAPRRYRQVERTSPISRSVTLTVDPPPIVVTVEIGQEHVKSQSPNGQSQVPTIFSISITSIMETLSATITAPITTTLVIPEVSITTVATTNGTAQILPTPTIPPTGTEGTIITSLEVTGLPTSAPLISSSIDPPTTIISTSAVSSVISTIDREMPSENIFQPIATGRPHASIPFRPDHPVPRLGINQTGPIGTNKFYSNFFLGDQENPTWTNPYSISWAKGRGESWGMTITHIDANQRVFGPEGANPPKYFINPLGLQSLVLSAVGLGSSTVLTTDHLTSFSAHVNLLPRRGELPSITFPLVQGMGFVTGIYNGGTPVVQSGILFRSVTRVNGYPKPGVTKYRILLEDGKNWFLYASSSDGKSLDFQVVNNGRIQATSNFNGFIQVAKDPGNAEGTYDAACGVYPTGVDLFGSVNGNQGSYTYGFKKSGLHNSPLLMFALPHHVQSLSPQTRTGLTGIQLTTTTKGIATAIRGDSWSLDEEIPISMGFAPWSPELGSLRKLSPAAIAVMKDIAISEVSQDMYAQSNLDSMYFSGKALAKFAGIVYTLHNLMDEQALGQAGLKTLKSAFEMFVNNRQRFPLVYESAWGGVVSTASYVTGNSGADFGNTYYNDHHFHYGYHIYTAAIIAHLDPTFLTTPSFSYIQTLIRDTANPSTQDLFFPVSRSFDYYNGHSWAKGLFPSADGKDQESTSEDMTFSYALKLFGFATGNANLEAIGNLQLAITARSLKNYFLYDTSNTIQPAIFTPNKVAGILFENKIDHTTYFGNRPEHIQGIHMLPVLPCSTLSRSKRFVGEEWDVYFSGGRVDRIEGGWRGVLYANFAILNGRGSWDFFAGRYGWDQSWIDGGASRTWSLAMAAGLGGSP